MDALKSDQRFSMVYQPIVSVDGNDGENYEAFLRMNAPDGSQHLPGNFIPAAEQAGLMQVVDQWVIRHASRVLAKETSTGRRLSIFIKLSKDSLRNDRFSAWLGRLIEEKSIPASTLVFQLTEADVMTHLAQAKVMVEAIRALGCRIVLDRFGSDLNSFSLLHHLDVDFLKIDGALVHDLSSNRASQMAVKSITEMARSLGKTTIAGFVQDAGSLAILWQCGVDYIQGYFLQEPSSAMDYDFSESETA